jgi:hypothetical protein
MSEIGKYVYLNYRPKMIGKVVNVIETVDNRRKVYEVKWIDGETSTEWCLNYIENLIADHEKKLATHRANLEKAKAKLG